MLNHWQQRLQRMFLLDFQPVRFVRIGRIYLKPKQHGQKICIGQDTRADAGRL